MSMSGDDMAAEILEIMDLDGVFDSITDEAQKEQTRAKMLEGLGRITRGIVEHIQANAVVQISAGAVVVDALEIPIGTVQAHSGVIL